MNRSYITIEETDKVVFGIDEINANEIKECLKKHHKRAMYIFSCISAGSENSNIYEKYSSFKDVSAIKFKGNHHNNARIYCKDFSREDGKKYVILVEYLPSKKQNELTRKELTMINRIENYEY